MKKNYTLLAIAALALSLFSCQKEQVSIGPSTSEVHLTPQEKQDKLSPALILFQYSYVNLETGKEAGWIIDRSGNVRTYEYTRAADAIPVSENEKWQEADLANLYALTIETVATIEIEELLSRAHQGLALSKKFLNEVEINDDNTWVSSFYAFTQTQRTSSSNTSAHNGCYRTPNYAANNTTNTQINRLIISLSGHINRYETSTYATDLHQWLLALNEGL